MVCDERRFIGTPNSDYLKPPPDDDNELFMSETEMDEEPTDNFVYFITDDENDSEVFEVEDSDVFEVEGSEDLDEQDFYCSDSEEDSATQEYIETFYNSDSEDSSVSFMLKVESYDSDYSNNDDDKNITQSSTQTDSNGSVNG